MLKTEEEARALWCCVDRSGFCSGSDCMGWRWVNDTGLQRAWDLCHGDTRIHGIKEYRGATGATLKEAKEWSDRVANGDVSRPVTGERGFCGRAGRPDQ